MQINNINGSSNAPISSGTPDFINISKNKNIAKIKSGNRQIFIFLAILLIDENGISANFKATQILRHNPISRKISGMERFRNVLPKKSIIGAITIGIRLMKTLFRSRVFISSVFSTCWSNVKYPIIIITMNGIIIATMIIYNEIPDKTLATSKVDDKGYIKINACRYHTLIPTLRLALRFGSI